jgi:hypothetical protein
MQTDRGPGTHVIRKTVNVRNQSVKALIIQELDEAWRLYEGVQMAIC